MAAGSYHTNASDIPRCLFQVGKGGVGKSTISVLTALAHARAGKRVLLLSLDPAHNLGDIFAASFGDTPVRIPGAVPAASNDLLDVLEPDVDRWIARYLENVLQRVRENYRYLTALNLDQYFRVLRHSPGLEEFALRAVFQDVLRRYPDRDVLVVDMPPTALALRFFASPTVSGVWTDELLRLRHEIKEKREIITRIRLGKKSVEQDRVLTRLEEEREANASLRTLFSDHRRTHVSMIVNPDTLSWMEAQRFAHGLQALD
ncbi:MAG: ArsA family ATPase, partial [Bacteroidetes bacterium]|nr:ArsA family ATPase [Bacteroidota bacterium]